MKFTDGLVPNETEMLNDQWFGSLLESLASYVGGE